MNPNSRKIRLYILIMLVLSAAAVTLRTIACIKDLGYLYGYFSDRALINISGYIAAGSALVLLSYPIFAEKMNAEASFSTPATYIPTGVVSVCLPYLAITILTSPERNSDTITSRLALILIILSILSVFHFFLTAFNTDADAETRGYFSLATVLFLALYAAYLYFDTTLPLNSTNKVIDQMAFLSASLFFLYESRISLTREKWGGYVTFGLVAALFTAYSSIPSLIVYIAKGASISNSIEESVFTLTLFLFITFRLVLASLIKEKRESEIIMAMGDFAEARSAMINESMKVHKEAFAVQMTIDDLIGDSESELIYVKEISDGAEGEDEDEAPEEAMEQMDFFCEGGLEISESDADSLVAEPESDTDSENEEKADEENTGN